MEIIDKINNSPGSFFSKEDVINTLNKFVEEIVTRIQNRPDSFKTIHHAMEEDNISSDISSILKSDIDWDTIVELELDGKEIIIDVDNDAVADSFGDINDRFREKLSEAIIGIFEEIQEDIKVIQE